MFAVHTKLSQGTRGAEKVLVSQFVKKFPTCMLLINLSLLLRNLLLHPVLHNLNSVYPFTFHILWSILILSLQKRLYKLKVSNKSFVSLSYLPRVCCKAHLSYSASFTFLTPLCLEFIIFSRMPTLFSFIPLAIKMARLYWADEQTFSFIKVVLYLIKSLDFQLGHYLTKIFISTSPTDILHSMVRQVVFAISWKDASSVHIRENIVLMWWI